MMFRERLSFLKNRYISRFNFINLFSREDSEVELFNGRLTPEKISALIKAGIVQLDAFDSFFLCGPNEMVDSIRQAMWFIRTKLRYGSRLIVIWVRIIGLTKF